MYITHAHVHCTLYVVLRWLFSPPLSLPLFSTAAVGKEKESSRSVPEATPVTGEWCTLPSCMTGTTERYSFTLCVYACIIYIHDCTCMRTLYVLSSYNIILSPSLLSSQMSQHCQSYYVSKSLNQSVPTTPYLAPSFLTIRWVVEWTALKLSATTTLRESHERYYRSGWRGTDCL